MSKKWGSVLVIGGGIGGIQATIDLANSGFKVFLLDEKPYLGGKMVQLYRTFEDMCSICMVTPKILEARANPNVTLLPGAKVKKVFGIPGQFDVLIEKAPRYVDVAKCISCGLCWTNCPVTLKSEFNYGLGVRKAIYMAYAGAVPNTPVIDRDNCLYFKDKSCTACVDLCPTKAVNLSDAQRVLSLKVGAILFTGELDLYERGKEAQRLGLGKIEDVISNYQLERLISIYGPTLGELKRPSDGNVAERVGIVLCVDQRNDDYRACSGYCCPHALRAAFEIIKKSADAKVTIFYDELCSNGYLWERVYREVKSSGRLDFVKAEVLSCEQGPGEVKVRYEGGEASFDLVALSLPMKLSDGSKGIVQNFGLGLDQAGFVKEVEVGGSEREGIFVGATATGPREIPVSVAYAEAAACEASCFLREARGTMITVPQFPKEKDVEGEEPRIGIFLCKCGGNISNVLNVSEISIFARQLKDVVGNFILDFACLPEGISLIKEIIQELNLNRMVVVACSFRSHLAVFQGAAREVGLNPYLVTMVNAREAISWTNQENRNLAMERLKEELSGAVARARSLKPLSPLPRQVTKKALVLGGGVSGMVAASGLARQGFFTDLVEKREELGGHLRRGWQDLKGRPASEYLSSLIEEVEGNELIRVHKGSRPVGFCGHMGNFETEIEKDGKRMKLEHGVLIIATGADQYVPKEYGYGRDQRVLTQFDLEERLSKGEIEPTSKVFMLQCVGSRDEEHPYCSRVCCQQAIKNAMRLSEMGVAVTVGTRGMCTPGTLFDLYQRARDQGVNFVEVTDGVQVEGSRKLAIKFDNNKGQFDQLILSTGIVKGKNNDLLSFIFGVPLNSDGFFEVEGHVATISPVELSKRGILVCGLAEGPKTIEESVAQAKAAAQRAATILSKNFLLASPVAAKIDNLKCAGCLTCVKVCPFSVPHIGEKGVVEILAEECRGCGICASECPINAIQLEHFRDEQVLTQIEGILSAQGGG
ncbi:MAG: FAD-dependent oxidoreductase [Deltaproteobacteria bacterium]|jgi:heterodisulfide reductase subunit A